MPLRGHYKEVCQYGRVHGQCRCPDKNKMVVPVECSTIDQHKPSAVLTGGKWLYQAQDGTDREAILEVPQGYDSPPTMILGTWVTGGYMRPVTFGRIKRLDDPSSLGNSDARNRSSEHPSSP